MAAARKARPASRRKAPRKQAPRKPRGSAQATSAVLRRDLNDALAQKTAIAEILKVIARSPSDVQPVFDAIADSALRLFGGLYVVVALVRGEQIVVGAAKGTTELLAKLDASFPIALDRKSITGRVIVDRRAEAIPDMASPDLPEFARALSRDLGMRAVFGAPMLREGAAIGAIMLARNRTGEFSARQVELLKTFADQAVIAIENVRLFNETKEALEHQKASADILRVISGSPTDLTPVMAALAESAARLCEATDAHIWQREGDDLQLVASHGPLPIKRPRLRIGRDSVAGRAAFDCKLIHVHDLAAVFEDEFPNSSAMMEGGYRSVLAVPLVREGVSIGAILIRRTEVRPFTPKQLALLHTFADQAVIAIENVRLFNETKEALERQTATTEILKVISSSPTDIQPVLDAVAQNAARLCEASDAIIQLREGDRLRFVAHYGSIPNLPQDSTREISRERVTGRAVLEARQIHVHDLPAESVEYPEGSVIAAEFGYRTILATPLIREGNAIGIIMTRRIEARPFSDRHLDLVRTFADQAVIAIENVRLFNETKEALERQTATADILKVIASSPADVQPVLDAIAGSAARLFAPHDVTIIRLESGMLHFRAWAGSPGSQYNPESVKSIFPFPFDIDRGPSARAITERRIVEILDTEAPGAPAFAKSSGSALRFRSGVWVPLLREGRGFGTLVLTRPTPGTPMTERQLALLRTFADQAVIAIENVRLFNELQDRNREVTDALEQQTATAEILRVISASPTDVQPVFNAIASSALRLFGGLYVIVALVRGKQIVLGAGEAPPEVLSTLKASFPIPIDRRSVTGRAIVDRAVQNVPDMESPDLPELARALSRSVGVRALLGAPMLREGDAIGTILLARKSAGEFSAKQVALLESFADQAVIAIENVRLFNETKEALERQTATAEVLQVISGSVADAAPVFDKILASCRSLFGDCVVTLGLLDENGMVHLHQEPELFVHPDEAIRKGTEIVRDFHPRPSRDSIYGYVAFKRQVVHFPDVQNGPDVPEAIRKTVELVGANYSALYAPLVWEGRGVGTLNVSRFPPAPFLEKEIRLLKTFADQAVIAIQNERLFNETKEALERQTATAEILKVISESPTDTQPVFNAIVQSGLKLFPGSLVSVALRYGDAINAAAVAAPDAARVEAWRRTIARTPLARNYMHGAALLDRRIVDIPDVADTPADFAAGSQNFLTSGNRAITIMPLMRGDNAIGLISVVRQVAGPLSDRQRGLLRTFADQAVIAIENVRLFNETKEALERQTATAEILKVISESLTDVQPVFNAIVESCTRLLACNHATLRLVKGDRAEFAASSSTQGGKTVVESPMSIHDDSLPVSNAVLRREVVQIPDTSANGVPVQMKQRGEQRGFRSLMVAPLLRDNDVIGTINVHRTTPGRFTEKEVALLETFASQAVIAIENARLFNETKEALERQTATAEILRVISSTPSDTQPVFDAIVNSTQRLIGGKSTVLLLRRDPHFVVAAYAGPDVGDLPEEVRVAPLDREKNFPSRAILDAKVLHIPSWEGDDIPEHERVVGKAFGIKSGLFVPLLREGKGFGAIAVTRGVPGPYHEREVTLLRSFADQAVIAIENVRLFNETKEALERQTATAEILKVISGSPTDVQPVFDAIAKSAQKLLSDAEVGIALVRGDRIELVAAAGLREDRLNALRTTFPRPLDLESSVNRTAVHGQTIHYPDVQAHDVPAYTRDASRLAGVAAMLGVPLMREGKPIGGVFISKTTLGAFSEKQIELLRTFADQAVIAIENVRLFNETKEALERQTAISEILRVISSSPADVKPVLDAVAERAARICEARVVDIILREGETMRVAATFGDLGRPLGEAVPLDRTSVMGRSIVDGQTVHVADLQNAGQEFPRGQQLARKYGHRTILAVPLIREGPALGTILVRRVEARPFQDKHIALLRTFADQAAIAIENVRLFNETKEALERQTATAEILKVISGSPTDVRPVFDAIVSSAVRLCDAVYSAAITLENGMLHLVAYKNWPAEGLALAQRLFPMPLESDHLSAIAVRENRVIHKVNLQEDPEAPASSRELAIISGYNALLIVPMVREGRSQGVVAVARRNAFSNDQIALLQTFADQAVIAIENVRLFEALQQRTEALTQSVGQLTALGEVSQAISSTLDLETVLKTIVSRAVQLTGLDGGVIYEFDEPTERFELRASENFDEQSVLGLRSAGLRKGEGAVGASVATRELVQVPDTHAPGYPARLRALLDRSGFRALLAVPLAREEQIIGALLVLRASAGPFAPEIIELLKTFATQSALAIQNARLFREIEDKGRQLEVASRHKSDFLASMSHELRTPLNAILGFNEMILAGIYGEAPPDMQEPLADIQASGKHLLRLINNVLDLAKIEAGRMELALADYAVQDVVESVRSTLRPLAADKGLEFLASVPQDIPLAYGDSGRLTQCLMNLAGNSLKFTKAGRVEILVEHNDGLLTYCVADTGIGIPPDKIGSLFTEFKQTDATIASEYGGTGLGLSISRKFVEMHGGRIWVESEPGKGSKFIFELPLRVQGVQG